MLNLLKSIAEIFGIVYLRFRWLPRLWCLWLVTVNAACLFYLPHIEAQVVLAVTAAAVLLQGLLYQRTGFTRLLGIVHLMWIPMFIWIASRSELISDHPGLNTWLSILLLTNLVSLVIDTVDVTRFIRGERVPHYTWKAVKATV